MGVNAPYNPSAAQRFAAAPDMGSAGRFDAFASTPDAFENLFAQPGTDLLDHGTTRDIPR
jgi:hypothetical protein